MSGLKSMFFGLWIYMEIQYVGVRDMEECKVNPKHFVDSYGCLDCWMDQANRMMWKKIIEEEENERV